MHGGQSARATETPCESSSAAPTGVVLTATGIARSTRATGAGTASCSQAEPGHRGSSASSECKRKVPVFPPGAYPKDRPEMELEEQLTASLRNQTLAGG